MEKIAHVDWYEIYLNGYQLQVEWQLNKGSFRKSARINMCAPESVSCETHDYTAWNSIGIPLVFDFLHIDQVADWIEKNQTMVTLLCDSLDQ